MKHKPEERSRFISSLNTQTVFPSFLSFSRLQMLRDPLFFSSHVNRVRKQSSHSPISNKKARIQLAQTLPLLMREVVQVFRLWDLTSNGSVRRIRKGRTRTLKTAPPVVKCGRRRRVCWLKNKEVVCASPCVLSGVYYPALMHTCLFWVSPFLESKKIYMYM